MRSSIASEPVTKPARSAQGVPRPSMETPTTRPTRCLVNASAAGPGEAGIGGLERRGPRGRRRHREDGVGAGECLVDNRRVAVLALDDVEVLADVGREL